MWLLSLLILAWTTTAGAERINEYRTTLAAGADGSLRVEERIEYDFGDLQRHGIYRDIPHTVPAPWGGRRRLAISDVSVERDRMPTPWSEESVHGDAGPMLRLRIGAPDSTVSGSHTYTIRYQVADAMLPAGKRDAFRWNAIGTGWAVPIRSAEVMLRLPVELHGHPDVESRFFTGPWGATDQKGQDALDAAQGMYKIRAGPLAPHEGVTVEVSFPVGAIPATAHLSASQILWQSLPHLWAWPLMLIGLGFAWRHWNLVGRDPFTGAVAVRYRPPERLEAAEAGLLIDQSLDKADLTGTVIELARDGWLKIERPADSSGIVRLLKRSRVTLQSLRQRADWEELPPYKRYLLESLFCRGDRFSPGRKESASDFRERKKWLDRAKSRIHERGVEHGLFPESPRAVRTKYLAGAALLGLLLLGLAWWRSPNLSQAKLPGLFLLSFVSVFAYTSFRNLRRSKRAWLPFLLILAIGIPLLYQSMPIIRQQLDFSFTGWGFILTDPLFPTVLLIVGLFFFAWQMPRRTNAGARLRQDLLGFKKFMQRAEAPRLRAMLEEDPGYFERTLPYAALFGLVAKWLEAFKGLVTLPPWYEGGSLNHLGQDLNQLRNNGVTSSPPASSGGSSGGGGFSGGGGGGGGGGSW
jgi:uncharacterized membrane protein YgcG